MKTKLIKVLIGMTINLMSLGSAKAETLFLCHNSDGVYSKVDLDQDQFPDDSWCAPLYSAAYGIATSPSFIGTQSVSADYISPFEFFTGRVTAGGIGTCPSCGPRLMIINGVFVEVPHQEID